jgi:hypothetical protein
MRPKSTRGRNRRNPLTFSMRQKKKERSEIRKNAAPTILPPNLEDSAEDTTPDQSENHTHAETEIVSLAEEKTAQLSPVIAKATTSSDQNKKNLASDTLDIYDPARIFPYTNKRDGVTQKTIAEESKQWESLFDPQHSFGSFQHAIAKPVASYQYFYKGKWPLDTKDIMGMVPPNGNADRTTKFLFPSAPDPTLPDLEQLEQYINAPLRQEEEPISMESSMASLGQIEILPCASLSSFPKYKIAAAKNDQSLWKDRLELLNTIQQQGFREEWNGTQNAYSLSKTARLKRKAEKLKREASVHSHTTRADYKSHLVNIEPDIMFQEEEQSSLASLEDETYDINEKEDMEKQIKEKPELKRRTRLSFLLFVFGFAFPPLWVIGALYTPTMPRTSFCQKVDQKWRRCSRQALFVFMILVAAVVVLVLALKPQAVGLRNSNEEGYKEERVVFDENDSNIAGRQQQIR